MPPKTTDDNTGADQAAADAGEANGEAAVAAVEQAEAEQEELAEDNGPSDALDEFGNPIPDDEGNDAPRPADAEQLEEDPEQLDEDLEQLDEDEAPAPDHGSHNAAMSGHQTDASGSYTPPGLVGNPQLGGSTFKQQ